MLGADEMPDDNSDLASVDIDFPRLADDSPASCPLSMASVLDYLSIEVPDGERLSEGDLRFERTAYVEGSRYWIWSFDEPDGDPAYVTVSVGRGGTIIGYADNFYRLTPEQFMLGDYHQVF